MHYSYWSILCITLQPGCSFVSPPIAIPDAHDIPSKSTTVTPSFLLISILNSFAKSTTHSSIFLSTPTSLSQKRLLLLSLFPSQPPKLELVLWDQTQLFRIISISHSFTLISASKFTNYCPLMLCIPCNSSFPSPKQPISPTTPLKNVFVVCPQAPPPSLFEEVAHNDDSLPQNCVTISPSVTLHLRAASKPPAIPYRLKKMPPRASFPPLSSSFSESFPPTPFSCLFPSSPQ